MPSQLPKKSRHPAGYVLLEVVIATGLLVVALSIIGAQIQDSGTAIHRMERRTEAARMAEQYLAFMDMGLIDLDSVDEVQEGDFGPRFPNWGWRLTTEPTAVEGMFRLYVEILFYVREDEYREDDFPYDDAEVAYTVYALRPATQTIDLAVDFGLTEEEIESFTEKFGGAGLPIDPGAFDPRAGAYADPEQLFTVLPVLLQSLGLELGDIAGFIPPEILEQLEAEGLLGGEGEREDGT